MAPSDPAPCPVPWLDEQEQAAWRPLAEISFELVADLDAELQAACKLALADYQVLVVLSEAPGTALRMCDLAARLHLSPSGLTRRLDGLVRAGLVQRNPSQEDRRVILAVLTAAGRRRLEDAAPEHVRHVRRQVFDHLERADVEQLAAVLGRLHRARHAAATARP